ncbi:hypothetical protein DCAR_0207975 [Daucus carota subsp. sativus]|uniref:Uncharacterized protein n=1 Tax=Daucus carota subsp. sativus TaxID=79200 RepID=A0A162AUU6_DAUCS|nr:hypothetical protein DCAR_0207975 [Daucus carota subsp. sativus]
MASFNKLNIIALLLIFLLSACRAPCSSASSLHQREKHNPRWFSNCRHGYRKMGHMNCENAGGITNTGRVAWSESLRKALPPPPAPTQRMASPYGGGPPPTRR